jgi:hypothetical protein
VCFVRISEQTANFTLYNINRLVFITEVECVYCAVQTESLYRPDKFRFYKVKIRDLDLTGGICFSMVPKFPVCLSCY